jgi:hypothetical protein
MQFTVLLPQDVQMTFMIFSQREVARNTVQNSWMPSGAISLCTPAIEAGLLLIGP